MYKRILFIQALLREYCLLLYYSHPIVFRLLFCTKYANQVDTNKNIRFKSADLQVLKKWNKWTVNNGQVMFSG